MRAGSAGMRRGSPLAMLAVIMAAWIGGRALTWENPFAFDPGDLIATETLFAENERTHSRQTTANLGEIDVDPFYQAAAPSLQTERMIRAGVSLATLDAHGFSSEDRAAETAFGHQLLWLRALGTKLPPEGAPVHALQTPRRIEGVTPISPPVEEPVSPDRWSVDAWAFWRQGSNGAPISQGRVPVYGASQAGAKLEYRAAPSSRNDPRLYLRAYRALVSGGETEVAAGASARPFGAVPVRIAAELRATENRFGTELRPAIVAVSELPAHGLPAGFRLEAYGGAGYVGGDDATLFADGQMSVTRELAQFEGPAESRARLSLGAGAWGGAQEDASRVDVGPTMRVDLRIGEVPARISVDWRERVGGDAAPDSGIAATLSTRF